MEGGGPGGGQDGSSPFFGHIQLQHQMMQGMQQDACFKGFFLQFIIKTFLFAFSFLTKISVLV